MPAQAGGAGPVCGAGKGAPGREVNCPQSVLRMQSEGVRVPSLNGNDRITIDGSVPSVPAD